MHFAFGFVVLFGCAVATERQLLESDGVLATSFLWLSTYRRLQRVRLFLCSFVLYIPWIPGEHRRGICAVECVTAHLRGFEEDSRSEVVFWMSGQLNLASLFRRGTCAVITQLTPRTYCRLPWHVIAWGSPGIPTWSPRTTTCSTSAISQQCGTVLMFQLWTTAFQPSIRRWRSGP